MSRYTPEQERWAEFLEFRRKYAKYLWTVLEWDHDEAKLYAYHHTIQLHPDGDYCRRRSPAQEKAIAELYTEE